MRDVSSPAEFLQALNELSPRMRDVSSHDAYRDEPNWLSPRMRMFPGALPAAPEPPGFPRVCGMFPIPLAVACV